MVTTIARPVPAITCKLFRMSREEAESRPDVGVVRGNVGVVRECGCGGEENNGQLIIHNS